MKRVLTVCFGNSDRSPAMAAVLGMYLDCAGIEATIESVGTDKGATGSGSGASPFAKTAVKRLGLDLTGHVKRHISAVELADFDLVICPNDDIAGKVVELGADRAKVHCARIENVWPVGCQENYDAIVMPSILAEMYRVLRQWSHLW